MVMTVASATGGMVFNMTTNGNGQLLAERLRGVVDDPATEPGRCLARSRDDDACIMVIRQDPWPSPARPQASAPV